MSNKHMFRPGVSFLGKGCLLGVILLTAIATASCTRDPAKRKQAFFESGNAYFTQSKFPEAILQYRNAIQIDPQFAAARVKLADAYVRTGDGTHAVAEYVRAADLRPDDLELQLTAGTYLLAGGRAADAQARADAVLKKDPRNVRAHVLRGNALAGLKDVEAGVEELEQAVQLDPNGSSAYASLGMIELARGNRDEAEQALRKAVSVAPKWWPGHLALANFYLASGRPIDARKSLEEALRIDPKNELANRAMAALVVALGKRAEAEPYLKRAADRSRPLSVLALADYYLASNRPSDAIQQLDLIKNDARVSAVTEERLVRAYAASGERARAHSIVDEKLERNAKDARAHLLKGQLLLQEAKTEEAFTHIRTSTELDPHSAMAQFVLGRLYAARGDIPAAEAAFKAVLNENPRAAVAQTELAKLYLVSNRGESSTAAARQALALDPRSIEARLALVKGLVASQDLSAAERELQPLLAEHPNLPQVHVQAGVISALRKDAAGARAAFERALALDANSVEALGGLTVLDLSTGNVAVAKARIDMRLARGEQAAVLLLAARTYTVANDFRAAEGFLRKAIEQEPTLLPAYGMLGQLYLRQRKLPDAKREFAALASRHTKPAGALTVLGTICEAEGNASAAEEHYKRALAADPNAAVAANNLAWMYAERGENLDIALQLARAAVAALPESPEVNDTLGWVLLRKHLASSAVPSFQQAVQLAPGNPVLQYHLGLALAEAGDATGARLSLQRALSLKSDFDGAPKARAVLQQLEKPSR